MYDQSKLELFVLDKNDVNLHHKIENTILHLYRIPNWIHSEDVKLVRERHIIESIILNSFCFVYATYEGRGVGMGRVISDGVSDAYIQDVVVEGEFRKSGLGRRIVEKLIEELEKKNVGWIGLISEPGNEGFYEKIGFRELKDHVPMLLIKH